MNRQGSYRKNLTGKSRYLSFCPSALPPQPEIELTSDIFKLIAKSYNELGKLDGISSRIPNKNIFVSMHIRKEALLSSQIEGTQATLDDIFDPSEEKNTNQEVIDVINYIKALDYVNERNKELPISTRLLKEVHKILLKDIRGENKNPGEIRKSQNWIGPRNSTINTAVFVPPNVIDMNEGLNDLEEFIHNESNTDLLIKIALIHYQFETIHPFLDGNGRIGRLLINLLLKKYILLSDDILYLSYYLKRNRAEYYDRLMAVREKGHYEEWIKFFLKGIIESSKDAMQSIDLLLKLQDKHTKLINENVGRAKETVLKIFELLHSNPIIDVKKTSETIGVTFKTTSNAIDTLVSLGILVETSNKQRYRIYVYEEYLKILRKGTE